MCEREPQRRNNIKKTETGKIDIFGEGITFSFLWRKEDGMKIRAPSNHD